MLLQSQNNKVTVIERYKKGQKLTTLVVNTHFPLVAKDVEES